MNDNADLARRIQVVGSMGTHFVSKLALCILRLAEDSRSAGVVIQTLFKRGEGRARFRAGCSFSHCKL